MRISCLLHISFDFVHKIETRPLRLTFTRLRISSLALPPVHSHSILSDYITRPLYCISFPKYSRSCANRLTGFADVGACNRLSSKSINLGTHFIKVIRLLYALLPTWTLTTYMPEGWEEAAQAKVTRDP